MITLNLKREILLKYQNGYSKSEIARQVGSCRKTVRKYINEYEDKITKMGDAVDTNDDIKINALVEELSEKPKYTVDNRVNRKLNDDIISEIERCLKDNENKILNRNRKQIMKKIDIYELLVDKGFDIGYTTVCNYIRNAHSKKEAYIKQEYNPGETLEFDWGEVKLMINGVPMKFQLALFSTCFGSYHFATLYNNQKMQSFLDAHVQCFKHLGGVHKEIVYDNMKVAVKKFIGPTEKEATEDLMKISMYYGFNYRFCNARKGNEKGTVERGVEYVRRKAFARQNEFNSLKEANEHLAAILIKLNAKNKPWLNHQSALDKLNEEREELIKAVPDYVIYSEKECRVDKYSTITIEQNRYSVPEYLVGKFVKAKSYPEKIDIYYKNSIIATQERSYKAHDWVIDINHYIHTLKKKPGALHNSTAMQCCSHRIQEIYHDYYIKSPREFIDLLEIINEKGLNAIESTIDTLKLLGSKHVTTEKIKNIVNQKDMPIQPLSTDKNKEITMQSIVILNTLTQALMLTSERGNEIE